MNKVEYEMQKLKGYVTIALFILSGLLASCGMFPQAEQEPEPTLAPVQASAEVIAEGRLVPYEHVTLAFSTGGQIAEVLVVEGEMISSGQVIARLNHFEQAAAQVAAAQVEQVNAEQALEDLNENADLAAAGARQQVAVARDAARHAQWRLDSLLSGSKPVDIDSAQADVVLLRDQLEEAQKDFAGYRNKPEDDVQRATYLSRLADAQHKYDNAVSLLNNLEGSATEIDQAIAEAELALAEARLQTVEQDYAALEDGPDPDELAKAQSRLKAAEARLAAAEAAQEDLTLVAPFEGEVVDLSLKAGEQVAPGQPAVVLADFSRWLVETDDLTEMEVTEVFEGQRVWVTPDALPELQLQGVVASISNLHQERRGDVVYTVKISLQKSDPRLRWGMTVETRFENDQSQEGAQP